MTDLQTYEEFVEFFTPKNKQEPEIHGGFVRGWWCGDEQLSAPLLGKLKVTIRCLPRDQAGGKGKCVLTGKEATVEAIFAKAY